MTEPGRELKSQSTPYKPTRVANAIALSCHRLGIEPVRPLIATLMAHSALETGHWGKYLRNNNLGNMKATRGWITQGGDYTFYKAQENLPERNAIYWLKRAKPRTDGQRGMDTVAGRTFQKNGKTYISVWFWPSAVQCRFRAFETLEDGADFHMKKLNGRYQASLKYAIAGNPGAFVDAIHKLGYFTANLQAYRKRVVSLYRTYYDVQYHVASDTELAAKRAATKAWSWLQGWW